MTVFKKICSMTLIGLLCMMVWFSGLYAADSTAVTPHFPQIDSSHSDTAMHIAVSPETLLAAPDSMIAATQTDTVLGSVQGSDPQQTTLPAVQDSLGRAADEASANESDRRVHQSGSVQIPTLPWWGYLGVLACLAGIIALVIGRRKKSQDTDSAADRIVSNGLHLVLGNAQHIGMREDQQDAFGFSDPNDTQSVSQNGVLALVADGMGGLEGGRMVSNLAAQTFLRAYQSRTANETIPQSLVRILRESNSAVLEFAEQKDLVNETGTTLVAAVVHEAQLYWISVGDSRLYLLRDGRLSLLTEDHDYMRHLRRRVAAGEISREEAESNPQRNALTSFLGVGELEEIDQNSRSFPLKPGDRLLLCSDGLYGSLNNEEIKDGLSSDPEHAYEALVQAALAKQRPRQDNVTAVTLVCEPIG